MEIDVGFEISYKAAQPTPMVMMLSIHPPRLPDIVGREIIVAEPNVPIGFYRDSFGNVCGRLVAPAGGVTSKGKARVGRHSGARSEPGSSSFCDVLARVAVRCFASPRNDRVWIASLRSQ